MYDGGADTTAVGEALTVQEGLSVSKVYPFGMLAGKASSCETSCQLHVSICPTLSAFTDYLSDLYLSGKIIC